MSRSGIFGAVLVALALSTSASADLIIDQEQTTGTATMSISQNSTQLGTGEIFTPTFSGINFIEFGLHNSGSTALNPTITLYDVTNTSNVTTVATTTATTVAAGYMGVVLFSFPSLEILTPGDRYAAIFSYGTIPSSGSTLIGYGAPTTGGGLNPSTTQYAAINGAKSTSLSDFAFAEGISAPEPSTLILGATGLLCLGGRWLLRHRRAQA
jgi:hypothetical protein